MQNNEIKSKKIKKVHKLLIICSVILALVIFWTWETTSPKPLGNRLEYVGRHDYGCIIVFCDSSPGSTYYYATDMSMGEVTSYFKHATLYKDLNSGGTSADGYDFSFLDLTSKHTGGKTTINYYENGASFARANHVDLKAKKHAVEISAKDYQLVKDAL